MGAIESLKRVAARLRIAGATLPAPEPQGTVESALQTGLCVALAIVENEIERTKSAQSARTSAVDNLGTDDRK